jgi:putative nucleotidyltransferase with HDIG domain
MKRVLFVDDEPRVLAGLKRMLYPIRNQWEMVFVASGKQALELLDQAEFDLLITDIRMPCMTGIDLLQEVVKRHPQVIRIVLSGTADQEFTLSSATLAHQYLVKPCDADTLRGTIERAFLFAGLLDQPALKQLITSLNTLPSMPSSYGKLLRVLRDSDASIHEVGKVIASDLGMTAKILQLVNSAFFGLRRHIGDPTEAVAYLGFETVKALALTVSAFSRFETHGHFCIEDLQNHSLLVGALAKRIAVEMKLSKAVIDDCFTGGLLHDVGKLVISANYPKEYDRALLICREQKLSLFQAEHQVLGASHAAIGGYLLWLWGLPDAVIEAVVRHHDADDAVAVDESPSKIVLLANALIDNAPDGGPDNNALGLRGLHDAARWQQLASELIATGGK